jgi:ATP-dependent Clp protease adaptor protein ClpS
MEQECKGVRRDTDQIWQPKAKSMNASAQAPTIMSMPMPTMVDQPTNEDEYEADRPWVVVVWDDPINTISYVTLILQKLFGYPREKAHTLTMQVHNEGKAAVANGPREKTELDVMRLHEHGLWATLEQG